MNILPKKRFHVRNKDNIARVRRDEAQALEEEEERQRRVDLAEQEARMQVLRQRATKSQAQSTRAEQTGAAVERAESADQLEHVNFFAAAEAGVKSASVKNKEHEAEKKDEQEKLEKRIGILTYLGQSSAEVVGKAWYDKDSEQRRKEDDIRGKKSEKFKRASDPLHRMNDYLRKKEEADRHRESRDKSYSKRHTHKTHHRHSSTPAASSSLSGAAKMQQLRQERLRREQQERHRAEQVLAKARGDPTPADQTNVPVARYSSQFNPHLARQNRSTF
eukprot:scpid88655/ scgid31862/ Leukocyte receptor cluster member 1 homolog